MSNYLGNMIKNDKAIRIFYIFNFLLCLVVKVLSIRANAIGPVLVLCGVVFYLAYRRSKTGVILYVLLSVIAVGALIYAIGMLYLIFKGRTQYEPFLWLCLTYIALGLTHIVGTALSIRLLFRKS